MGGVKNPMPGVVYMPREQLDGYVRDGVLTDETLIGGFVASFRRHGERTALWEAGRSVSYAKLDVGSDRGAAALWRLGLRPGDRALFQMRNCTELVFAFFACLKIGVIPVCTLAAHRQREIGYLGVHAAAKAHFVHADDTRFDMVAFAREMQQVIPTLEHIVTVCDAGAAPGTVSFEALSAAEDGDAARRLVEGVELDPYQVAVFQLSGGTSGVPKIIPRFSNEYRYAIQTVVDWIGLDSSVVTYGAGPFMHNAPLACFWGPTLLVGGEVAITSSMAVGDIEALFAERKPTWIGLPKVLMLRLKESGATERLSFAGVIGFVVTDSALLLSEMLGAPCLPIFGMTEGILAFVRPGESREALGITVGRPTSPHDVLRLLDPNSESPVAEGAVGELVVQGPSVIHGYYDAPERNVEAFTSDGFYRSGDLMRFVEIDGNRYMVFEGRIKDVIDRGGEKINCSEVENLLVLHPHVGAAACVGMPDEHYGERMCAFVVPREGAPRLTLKDVQPFLASYGLAKFKWPERIELVSDLPMTTSGKLSKPSMREIVARKLTEEQLSSA